MIEDSYSFVFTFGNSNKCIYCGEPADTVEHLIPWSFISRVYEKDRKLKGFCTYACRECNTLAGNRLFFTFEERVKFVSDRLRKKHKKDMTVVWDKSELSELHGNLKKWVRGKNFQNLLIRKRLSYPTEEEFWKILNQAREELYLDKRIPFKNKSYLLPDDYTPDWEQGQQLG